MNVEQRDIASIKPYEKNPRVNDDAVDAVARSIEEFGFRQPIVVDADGVIVCGHTRWKAARKLGIESVPVHVATDLSPEQIRAYRIADNKLAEMATWDMELLPIELAELQGMDVDLGLLGFSEDDLAAMLESDVTQGHPHGPGAGLRGGVPRTLVWVPAQSKRTPRGLSLSTTDEKWFQLGDRGRREGVLR